MKKKNKKNQIRMRFSTILLCCLAIVLCTAPSVCGEDYFGLYYDEAGEYDVTVDEINFARGEEDLEKNGVLDWLEVGAGATVNLYASVSQFVSAGPGSILNIYSGSVGTYVTVSLDDPYAKVTVYGTDFGAKEGGALNPSSTQLTVDNVTGGVLTGTYENGDPIELKFLSNIPIYLMETAVSELEIDIDIKPGSDLNNINLRSKGVVPVAVFTTDDFDASTIDPGTVKFAGASPERWKLCDVDGDGNDDMMLFHFKTQELQGLDEDSTEATLTGETLGGDEITGTDTVRIVSPKKKK